MTNRQRPVNDHQKLVDLAALVYKLVRNMPGPGGGGGGDVPLHALSGARHTASGLTVGNVIRAIGSSSFSWQQLLHGDLGSVGVNDHHNEVHSVTGSDHSGFPGGTFEFLRADGTFAVPPGGGGGGGDPTFQIFAGAGKTTVADSDFGSTPSNGTGAIAHNTTDGIKRLGVRVGGSWYHVEMS